MLLTPSKFSISLILFEPSSSISNSGKFKFSIYILTTSYLLDLVTKQEQFLKFLQMRNVLDLLDVVIRQIQQFQQYQLLQSLNFHDFVVIELEFY